MDTAILEAYEDGNYRLAYALFVHQPSALCASQVADICLRNLDDGDHSVDEAAALYVMAARAGDGDVYAWLKTVDQSLPERVDAVAFLASKLCK